MGRAIPLRLAKEEADVVIVDKYAAPRSLFTGDEGWDSLDAVVSEINNSFSLILYSSTNK